MKMLVVVAVLGMAGGIGCDASQDSRAEPGARQTTGLSPALVEGKWGFIDTTGKLAIQPQFDGASAFHEGLAAVRVGAESSGKWGFIDSAASFVIDPRFDATRFFNESLAPVSIGKK